MEGVLKFKTLFAVQLSCESCIDDVSSALSKVKGVSQVSCSLENQVCEVDGSAAPSKIAEAIQSTGRDAVLRGSGQADSAAVCILESYTPGVANPVRGLARIVQVATHRTIVDLTIQNHAKGMYVATIRQHGDVSRGAASTGHVWEDDECPHYDKRIGILGEIHVGETGKGAVLFESPVAIWKLIGRAIVISKFDDFDCSTENALSTIVGVIARSAGVWENQKTICSCSGKTIWEERKEQLGRGMV